jgi:hypothetical protein
MIKYTSFDLQKNKYALGRPLAFRRIKINVHVEKECENGAIKFDECEEGVGCNSHFRVL